MLRKIRFANLAVPDRTEVAYATVPFKQGEWGGRALAVLDKDGNLVSDAWVYPFGKRYRDGTHRYGMLLARVTVGGRDSENNVTMLSVTDTVTPGLEPQFKFGAGLTQTTPFSLHLAVVKEGATSVINFTNWRSVESNGMRLMVESLGRVGDFVAKLRLYIYNDQNLIKWELDVTGSNPDTTERIHGFDEIHFLVRGDQQLLHVRGANGRGAEMITPYKHFKLMRGSQGFFGDGQRQCYYGELITYVPGDLESAYSAAAAVAFEMYGMSQDWVEAGEAFGANGVVPETPVPVPGNGLAALSKRYVPVWNLMNRSAGNPWDDYPDGLTKTPGQTGGQFDFGVMKGWDVLHSGFGELVEPYRFLATEDAKRPGHYLESNGSPVTHKNHPRWVVWNMVTHWHFSVSPDRLGKTDPNAPYATNGWVGKDWQHFSSNLLYVAALLTGSHQLRDIMNVEVEGFLAGHTVPSEFPGWSTNARGEARGFGRPHLALLHHDTILDRPEILDKMIDRFNQVVKNQWTGANNAPVQPWYLTNDPRVFTNGQTAWVPWNNHLGWIGLYMLWLASVDRPEYLDIQEVLVGLGQTIVNWGWRVDSEGVATPGHGVKWLKGGAPITPAQFFDPNYWLPATSFNEWMAAVSLFAKDSGLFDASTRARAQQIWHHIEGIRLRNYNPAVKPYDTFGEWTAI